MAEGLRYAKVVYSDGKSVSEEVMSGVDVSRNVAAGGLVLPAVDVWQSLGGFTDNAVLMTGTVGRCSCWSLKAIVAPVGVVLYGRRRCRRCCR